MAEQRQALSERSIANIIRQIAKALECVHSRGLIHRDMKPENVLVTRSGCVKLADFGFAKLNSDAAPFTDYISTRWYRAPELLLKFARYDCAVDMFALGCIMVS